MTKLKQEMICRHLFLLILMYLTTSCSQITDFKVNSKCIPHIISNYFGNSSPINIWSEEMDDLIYIKDIKVAFRLINSKLNYDKGYAYPNFVVHTDERELKYILDTILLAFYRIKKLLIITNIIDTNINTMFNIIFKYELLNVILLVDGVSPMIYAYQPARDHNCQISTNSEITSNQYCDIKTLLDEQKPIINLKNCQISFLNYQIDELKNEDQFVVNKKILKSLEDSLNVSIIIEKINFDSQDIYNIQLLGYLPKVANFDAITGIEHDEMVWVVPRGEQLTTFQVIASTYDKTMWAFILVTFIVTLLSWCFLIFLSKAHSFPRNYTDCLFVLIQLTLSISLPQLPRRNIFRFVLVAYAIYSLHICTLFGANLVTILTVPKFQKGISSLDELGDSNMTIKVVQDPIFPLLFSSNKSTIQERLQNNTMLFNNDTICDILNNIVELKNSSLLVRKQFLPGGYDVNIISDQTITNPVNIGIYFQGDHHLLKVFQELISRMRESGLTNKILSDDMRKDSRKKDDSDIKLSMSHLLFAFLLLVGGLLLASLSFLIENLWACYFRKRDRVVILL